MPHDHLIFETSCGASGDMLLAALLDLFPDQAEDFVRSFENLGLQAKIRCRETEKNHLRCRQVIVETGGAEHLRHFADIRAFIDKTPFSESVRERALCVFERIFEAEAAVHGENMRDVHLHELGADDSLVDIVGFCYLWEKVGFPPIFFSTLFTGKGHIETRHGRLPVPPPAVLKLIEGCRCETGDVDGEILTPTGAAILTTLGTQMRDDDPLWPVRSGVGCGERTFPSVPNILRAILSRPPDSHQGEQIRVFEFFVDDMNGESLAILGERLQAAGSLDFFIAPGQMKKGRNGYHVTVLCLEEFKDPVTETILSESTTIGMRQRLEKRIVLEREERSIVIDDVTVRYKVATLSGREYNRKPEAADVRKLADQKKLSFKAAARLAARKIDEKDER